MSGDTRQRNDLVVTTLAWAIVIAVFVLLYVRNEPRETWLVFLFLLVAVVALVGLVRLRMTDVGSVRHKWSILALGTLFPPAERYLGEMEHRGNVVKGNETMAANLRHLMAAYDLGRCAGGHVFATGPTGFSAPEELTIEACAAELAALAGVRSTFPEHSPEVITRVFVLLYTERFDPQHPELQNFDDELAPALAAAVLRREELRTLSVDRGTLEGFLRTHRPFAFDRVVEFCIAEVERRKLSRTVVANMNHVLTAYDLERMPGGVAADLVDAGAGTWAPLTVAACAARAASLEPVRAALAPATPDEITNVLVVLYRERYAAVSPEVLGLGRLVARTVLRRGEFGGSGVGEDELAAHLERTGRFSLDAIRTYIRHRPTTVRQQMRDILDSYSPRDELTVPWPWVPPGLVNAMIDQPDGSRRITVAAEACAATATGTGAPSAGLIEFLYRRRFDRPTAYHYWDVHRVDMVPELAGVLSRSQRLPATAPEFSHDAERVQRVLAPLREYGLTLLRKELTSLQDLLDRSRRFDEFLVDQGIHHRRRPSPDDVLGCAGDPARGGLPANEHELGRLTSAEVSNELLVRFGREAIEAVPDLPEPLREPFCLVAVGEFLRRRHVGPAGAVQRLAQRAATSMMPARLLRGLLELRADPQARGGTLADLASHAHALAVDDEHDEQVRAIHRGLVYGNWPVELADLVGRTGDPQTIGEAAESAVTALVGLIPAVTAIQGDVEAIGEGCGGLGSDITALRETIDRIEQFEHDELEPKIDRLHTDDITALRAAIDRIEQFEHDELEPTLQRVRDTTELLPTVVESARLRTLLIALASPAALDRYYLITFDARRGPLAAVLDTLTHLTRQARRFLLDPASTHDLARARELVGRVDADYYRFGDYTRYNRVGILPEGVDFEEFTETLFADLRWLLASTDGAGGYPRRSTKPARWKDVEMTVLNLGQPLKSDLRDAGTSDPIRHVYKRQRSVDEPKLETRLRDVDPLRV